MCGDVPKTVSVSVASVNGNDNKLAAVYRGYIVNYLWIAHSRAIYGDLIGTGIEQATGIVNRGYAATNGERYVYAVGNTSHQISERGALLKRGTNVEIHKFIGAGCCIVSAELHSVANIFELLKIYALNRATMLHVKAGDDAFC
jgi:hypothetical protein